MIGQVAKDLANENLQIKQAPKFCPQVLYQRISCNFHLWLVNVVVKMAECTAALNTVIKWGKKINCELEKVVIRDKVSSIKCKLCEV